MAREGSKRQVAIEIMNSNGSKPMSEVLPLIAKANGIDVSAARSYYVWIVKNELAKGKIENLPRTAKLAAKPSTKRSTSKRAAVEKLKQSNLTRMRKAKKEKATA